jgi:hypothetical protein
VQFGLQFEPPEAFADQAEIAGESPVADEAAVDEAAEPEAKVVSLDQFRKK